MIGIRAIRVPNATIRIVLPFATPDSAFFLAFRWAGLQGSRIGKMDLVIIIIAMAIIIRQ